MPLHGKKIIIGITGGIAAYKIPFLIRALIKNGAKVRVTMTKAAKDFVTPVTLYALSKNPVISDFTQKENGIWNSHIEWGQWADLMIFAPTTANTISKMANGQADNFLTAVYLSAKCPVFIAPAMDLDMYTHPSTKTNIEKLKSHGMYIIPAVSGELASGLIGPGRMEEPDEILNIIKNHFSKNKPLSGKKVLITAGPTYEKIDPVRFIGNHSSGKMGIALAEEAANLGAEVKLILGPTNLKPQNNKINIINTVSAEDMYKEVNKLFPYADITIMSAAVADFTPKKISNHKIKKENNTLNLELKKTKDILKSIGKQKKKQQVLIGFAMETENELKNAQEKLKRKNLDFIVLNSLNEKNAGFRHDTNKITIIDNKNIIEEYPLKSKKEVAKDIFTKILTNYA